jgi:hypothetical protein
MLFATSQVLFTVIVIAAVVIALNLVISFFNMKEAAEKATVDNMVKRIAEHQGQERFNTWKATRAVLNLFLILLIAVVALAIYRAK